MKLKNYIEVLRMKQWLKNLLILFPAFFSLSILKDGVALHLLFLVIAFSLIASSIYIFNDLTDIKGDLFHPEKKDKPISSGKISKNNAITYGSLLLIIGFLVVLFNYKSTFYIVLTYVLINVFYSLGAKHIPVLDILLISSGFLIRIFIGGMAIGVMVSWWLTSLIFLMAIYILLAKRKDDVLCYQKSQQAVRKHIHFYKKINFKIVLNLLSLLIIIVYSFYTFSDVTSTLFKTKLLWITIPIAATGLFTFNKMIVNTTSHFEPINLILKNKIIVFSLVTWTTVFAWLIYG